MFFDWPMTKSDVLHCPALFGSQYHLSSTLLVYIENNKIIIKENIYFLEEEMKVQNDDILF